MGKCKVEARVKDCTIDGITREKVSGIIKGNVKFTSSQHAKRSRLTGWYFFFVFGRPFLALFKMSIRLVTSQSDGFYTYCACYAQSGNQGCGNYKLRQTVAGCIKRNGTSG
jgi:hypothetical protein